MTELIKRQASDFSLYTAEEWMDELVEQQWKQIFELFLYFFKMPPRAELSVPQLETIFDKYDKDQNGSLDKPEIKKILIDAFRKSFERNLSELIRLAKRYHPDATRSTDEALEIAMRKDFQNELEQRVASGEFDVVINPFFTALDVNHDGGISKREFVNQYLHAFQHLLQEDEFNSVWNADGWKPGNNQKKYLYYLEGAEVQHNPRAQYRLGLLFGGEDGRPTVGMDGDLNHTFTDAESARDLDELTARRLQHKYLQAASVQDFVPATHKLAMMYLRGLVPDDTLKGEMAGNGVSAVSESGMEKYAEERAVKLLLQAAQKDYILSCFQMGLLYMDGGLTIKADYPVALAWFEKAANRTRQLKELEERAEAGDAEAQFDLAVRYLLGNSFTQPDYKKALDLVRKAAEKEHLDGMYTLGLLYYVGIVDVLDAKPIEAKEWWQRAANRGHKKAQETLVRRKDLDKEQRQTRQQIREAEIARLRAEGKIKGDERGVCSMCEKGSCIIS